MESMELFLNFIKNNDQIFGFLFCTASLQHNCQIFNMLSIYFPFSGGQSNLFAMWTNRLNQTQSKIHEEFAGRTEHDGNGPAELYAHLKEENQA